MVQRQFIFLSTSLRQHPTHWRAFHRQIVNVASFRPVEEWLLRNTTMWNWLSICLRAWHKRLTLTHALNRSIVISEGRMKRDVILTTTAEYSHSRHGCSRLNSSCVRLAGQTSGRTHFHVSNQAQLWCSSGIPISRGCPERNVSRIQAAGKS